MNDDDNDDDDDALLSVLTTRVYMNYCILLAETPIIMVYKSFLLFNVVFVE
jgi:hypothetical protein